MVTADAHLGDAALLGLFEGHAEHLAGVAVLPLRGADAVADVTAVSQQIVVEMVAQVGHSDKMFLLVQSQILGGRYEPGRCGGWVFQLADVSQPLVEVVVFVQRRRAVEPGADGKKFFPVGHDLFAVALVRLPQVELLGRRMTSRCPEVRGLHQAVAVAVEVEYARTGDFETAAGVALRVKLDQL